MDARKSSERWSRRNIIATIFAGVLPSMVALGIFLSDSENQEMGSQDPKAPDSSESFEPSERLPTISISSIHLSEVPMDIPAVFEMGIQTGGVSDLSVSDVDVILDFGRGEIETCDHTPKSAIKNIVAEDKHRRHIVIAEMRKKEKLHIRCLISSPIFDQVIIQGGNIQRGVSMDFAQYQTGLLSDTPGFWEIIGRIFVTCFVGMICIWMLRVAFAD